MKLDSFTRAYIETALWSSTEYAFGECPCCGKNAVLSHYPEPEYKQEAMCNDCGLTEIANPEPMDDNYSIDDIAPATLAEMQADCASFQTRNAQDLESVRDLCDDSRAGHNFWLNRNGHGAGFWDEYFGPGKALRGAFTRLSYDSKTCGSYDLYIGDDGMIHGQ